MPETLDRPVVSPDAYRAEPVITLGVEEELQVVGDDGELVPHDMARGQREYPDLMGTSSSEVHQCALEIQTPVCMTPDEAVRSLQAMRAVAAHRAQAQGQRVLSAALHPFSRWADQALNSDAEHFPHYSRLLHEYGDISRSAVSFGMHVHLAPTKPELRMPVMNRLRNVLPDIMALTANAPFFQGRDTGLQSWRHSLLGRYPRMGIPDIWASEGEYWAHVERLRAAGSMDAGMGLWEDIRIHHKYGTLEVRIADAVHSLDRVWLVVALLQAEVATLEAELVTGAAPRPIPRPLLEDSKWRARRRGVNAEMFDWVSDKPMSFEDRMDRWLRRLAPAAARLGFKDRLNGEMFTALHEGAPADQQREWFRAGGFANVVDQLVLATAAPASWRSTSNLGA
ncbi:carboxylate-amine ligase [Roseateles asaccharophilus]|uniref:carboxylate-amine ligase n=1 Tax=Roseateles asaccharophilus TaxID=582607 RepID=UPI0038335307